MTLRKLGAFKPIIESKYDEIDEKSLNIWKGLPLLIWMLRISTASSAWGSASAYSFTRETDRLDKKVPYLYLVNGVEQRPSISKNLLENRRLHYQ